MIRVSALRFLLVVSPPATWMVVGLVASVLLGVVTLWLNPADIDSAFGSVLLLQMFCTSNGFAGSASRGHFDPLLAGGPSRQRIGLGSLAAAALPGLIAWMVIVAMAVAVGGWRVALAPHRHLALVLVSVIAWAGGLALPRMAAGGLWSLLLLSAALSRGTFGKYLVVVQSAPSGIRDSMASATAFAFCPYLLLGDFPAALSGPVRCADLILVLIVLWVALRYIDRRDYPLVEPA